MVTFIPNHSKFFRAGLLALVIFVFNSTSNIAQSGDTVYCEVAAIDQPFMYNRLGAAQPTGMIFALLSDLDKEINNNAAQPAGIPGTVHLRDGKRPRPIMLRANRGNVLVIKFTNLLAPYKSTAIVNAYGTDLPNTVNQSQASGIYPKTRDASIHIAGTEMGDNISSDGSWVGMNNSSSAKPGETVTYTVIVPEEGTFMLYSTGSNVANGGQPGGQLTSGLFGSLSVQPENAEWYRSQVTENDLDLTITHYEKLNADPSQPNIRLTKAEVPDIYNTENTYPIIDYDMVYPPGNSAAGTPILKMYKQIRPHFRQLVHTDLTAIITGPDGGDFSISENSPSFFNVPASPDRRQAYREFGIHYHEAPWSVQAFPIFYDTDTNAAGLSMGNTVSAGNDGFAINYGTGGISAEIFANRIGVGPMANCADCAYEEFFLSSWAVGDPSMIVDVPANAGYVNISETDSILSADITLQNQFLFNNNGDEVDESIKTAIIPKATKVLYPDDPSNVYHSYMNDHVKFRLTHAGAGIVHVHHQHAHQWLHSPNSDDGHYMDSQTINPGSSYTLEMVYDGSGNLNKTVGDQIFHCHFYPHFAAGMWGHWRVHDVLELGTELDSEGIAVENSRALPDGEIFTGTPIPGLVPIPRSSMAPVPSKVHIDNAGQVVVDDLSRSPGYPFYIPGLAGSRPPKPPMDFAQGTIYNEAKDSIGFGPLNGGLPRNVIYKADVPFENHTQYDWTKIITNIEVIELPEEGTAIEQVAMAAHATRNHTTMNANGARGTFTLNGLPPVPGAPFADPAVDINGNAVGTKRTYKAANIQLDVVLNKKGWHYPQQRIISLWGDVAANIDGVKSPEPFFFRANSGEFVEFWHTNLVPEYYELDDYQVRTPTDVIGQHIHLVKFDVTSSDGAANGFNYEDGTFAPDLVVERIHNINDGGKRYQYEYKPGKSLADVSQYSPIPGDLVAHAPNPIWGEAPDGQDWTGAQTTIQRWYADPLLNNKGEDRTVRTVFTHDHFGPSTHQQVGLYGGLLIEPNSSVWIDPINGDQLGSANNGVDRQVTVAGENMAVSDGGPTSWQANIVTANTDDSYREFTLEFQDNQQAYLPDSKAASDVYPAFPDNATASQIDTFTQKANAYRGWMDPTKAIAPNSYTEIISFGGRATYSLSYMMEPTPLRVVDQDLVQASGDGGDLAHVYSSLVDRPDPAFNSQPGPGSRISTNNDFKYPLNPLTPGMNGHDPYTPLLRAYPNDKIQIRTLVGAHVTSHFFNVHGANWLFEPSNQNSGYRSTQNMSLSEHFELNFNLPSTGVAGDSAYTDYLYNASSDNAGNTAGLWGLMRSYDTEHGDIKRLPNNPEGAVQTKNSGCPDDATPRKFDVTAISMDKVPGDSLWYNRQYGNFETDAVIFVHTKDLANMTNSEIEPIVLRALPGECIQVKLRNEISENFSVNPGTYSYEGRLGVNDLTTNVVASPNVGLHAELLSYDSQESDGANIGANNVQTAKIGSEKNYQWYAGKWIDNTPVPVEFGSVVLTSADPLEQYVHGLFGALIIEPEGSTWKEDVNSPNSANIYAEDGTLLFREFVLQFQDNLNITSDKKAVKDTANTYSAINNAINYKSAPYVSRLGVSSATFNEENIAEMNSNSFDGGKYPETPHLIAKKGTPVRIRCLHAGGSGSGEVFNLHGHVWQEEPYINNSTEIGYNSQSQWLGFRDQLGALNSFDLVISSAGGTNNVTGDYMYGSTTNGALQDGVWGIMTVTDGHDQIAINEVKINRGSALVQGTVTVNPETGQLPKTITLVANANGLPTEVQVKADGTWSFGTIKKSKLKKGFSLESSSGGSLKVGKGWVKESREVIIITNGVKEVHERINGGGVRPDRVEAPMKKMK